MKDILLHKWSIVPFIKGEDEPFHLFMYFLLAIGKFVQPSRTLIDFNFNSRSNNILGDYLKIFSLI
jgi:hypothetical protein